jgi:hypothetical protein
MSRIKKYLRRKRGTPKNAMGSKRPPIKKEAPLKTPRGSKRPPTKKDAPLKMQGAQKDLR